MKPAALLLGLGLTAAGALAQDSTSDVLEEARRLRMAAWRASIAAPVQENQDDSLAGAIQKIESVKTQPRPQAPTEPAQPQTPAVAETQPTATTEPAETLAALNRIDLASVKDLLSWADGLYQAGQTAQAQRFYQALVNSEVDAATKAWALFQLANCKRSSDPEAAMGLYQRVINEHPSCPWRSAAESRQRLIEWMAQHASDLVVKTTDQSPQPTTMPATGS